MPGLWVEQQGQGAEGEGVSVGDMVRDNREQVT